VPAKKRAAAAKAKKPAAPKKRKPDIDVGAKVD
jgi:hypothetical protein